MVRPSPRDPPAPPLPPTAPPLDCPPSNPIPCRKFFAPADDVAGGAQRGGARRRKRSAQHVAPTRRRGGVGVNTLRRTGPSLAARGVHNGGARRRYFHRYAADVGGAPTGPNCPRATSPPSRAAPPSPPKPPSSSPQPHPDPAVGAAPPPYCHPPTTRSTFPTPRDINPTPPPPASPALPDTEPLSPPPTAPRRFVSHRLRRASILSCIVSLSLAHRQGPSRTALLFLNYSVEPQGASRGNHPVLRIEVEARAPAPDPALAPDCLFIVYRCTLARGRHHQHPEHSAAARRPLLPQRRSGHAHPG